MQFTEEIFVATTDAAKGSQYGKEKPNKSFGDKKPYNKEFSKSKDAVKGEYKPKSGNGEYKPKSSNGEYKPRGEYKPKSANGEFKPKGEYKPKSSSNAYGGASKGFSYKDKDEDDDQPVRRTKTVQKDNKAKEVQTDKMEIQNRLEKEKKAMKKKQEEARKNSQKAPKQKVKPKRAGNIDWTRAYENDEYDDDDLDMYL